MPISAAELLTHMRYSTWASKRLVDVAVTLDEEELTRDFQSADKSVLGTLAHVYAVDRIWLARVQGHTITSFLDPAVDLKPDALRYDWPTILAQWHSLLGKQTDDSILRGRTYQNLKGEWVDTPLWQIVLHLVNHGTHHRGQVSGFLRAMGHTPPPLDLIAYYRERG